MKKLFTLVCALVGMTASMNAATVDDIKVCKHSQVFVMDDYNNNGTARPGKGVLFADGFILDVTGGSVATNKGKSNPAEFKKDDDGNVTEEYRYGEAFAAKYGAYGEHYNSMRLKNTQDMIAMKVTAGSKLIFLLQGNSKKGKEARYPRIATDANLENTLNDAPTDDFPATDAGFKYEWTAKDDYTIYIGSYNGDMFLGYIIVEANEAPGTPTVKAGEQKFENGLWYREVTCTPNKYEMFGETMDTYVTYTTDGTMPTVDSPKYTEPIKCYKDQTVKFQAFTEFGICEGADNEAAVSFSFAAPTISFDDATKTASFAVDYEGDVKFQYSYDGDSWTDGASVTLQESSKIYARAIIKNGSYGEFTSFSSNKNCYILNPITKETTIKVIAGEAVKDEAESEKQGKDVYMVEGGEIDADPSLFFTDNIQFGAVMDEKYQIDGKNVYLKMGDNIEITFKVEETTGVVVTCSKNSCKNIDATDAKDRACMVNVDGTNYGSDDILLENGNIIKFDLEAGLHSFKKYSGTGNILVSSIVFTPGQSVGIKDIETVGEASAKVAKVIKNGRIVIVKGNAEYNVAGAQLK